MDIRPIPFWIGLPYDEETVLVKLPVIAGRECELAVVIILCADLPEQVSSLPVGSRMQASGKDYDQNRAGDRPGQPGQERFARALIHLAIPP